MLREGVLPSSWRGRRRLQPRSSRNVLLIVSVQYKRLWGEVVGVCVIYKVIARVNLQSVSYSGGLYYESV